jgi:hypothetical protein
LIDEGVRVIVQFLQVLSVVVDEQEERYYLVEGIVEHAQ